MSLIFLLFVTRYGLGFIFFHIWMFYHHLLKKTKLSAFNCLDTFVENELIHWMDLLMDSILFHESMSLLLPVSHYPDYCNFTVNLDIRLCEFSKLFSFKRLFDYSGSFSVVYWLSYFFWSFSFSPIKMWIIKRKGG